MYKCSALDLKLFFCSRTAEALVQLLPALAFIQGLQRSGVLQTGSILRLLFHAGMAGV